MYICLICNGYYNIKPRGINLKENNPILRLSEAVVYKPGSGDLQNGC